MPQEPSQRSSRTERLSAGQVAASHRAPPNSAAFGHAWAPVLRDAPLRRKMVTTETRRARSYCFHVRPRLIFIPKGWAKGPRDPHNQLLCSVYRFQVLYSVKLISTSRVADIGCVPRLR